jgi:hypothetical protein
MPKLWGQFNRLVVPFLVLLALLALFGIYQRFYVKSQEAYLTEHGFHVLAAVGRQVDAYIDSVNKTVEAAGKNKSTAPAYLIHFLPKLLPDLGPRDLCFEHGSDQGQDHQCPEKVEANVFSLQFGESAPFRRNLPFPVAGRVRLDAGLRNRLDFGDEYFDDILIADQQGQVLFQKSPDNRIIDLGHLESLLAHSEASQPGDGAGGSSENGKPQAPEKAAPQRSRWMALSESSNVVPVTLAGDSYKLFFEPFQLSSDGRPRERVVLCGLWRVERLSSDSFALPYSTVIWFGLICVATGCFLWPFLKINYMNRTERLRRRDGWLLVLTMLLGTASVTLMILHSAYTSQVETEINDDLDGIAMQVQKNVDTEISSALDQLATLSATRHVEELARKPWGPSRNILRNKAPDLESYPYFDLAFWLDGTGQQKVKFTSDDMETPRTPFDEFPHFKNVIAGDHLIGRPARKCSSSPARPTPESSVRGECIERYSLVPKISRNTGRFSTLIFAPFNHSGRAVEALHVQALAISPLSLVNPVLPPNFGFAVLDRDGNVLFHSDARRNLSENFIQECKDPSLVQAALYTQSPQHLDIVYSGKDHRALLTKVTGLAPEPLTLVVFHDVDIDRTVELAIVLIVSVLMGVCGLFVLTLAFLDGLRRVPYPPEWMWPRPENAARYALIFAANSVWVLVFLLTYPRLWEVSLLFLAAGVALMGVLSTWLLVTRSMPKTLLRWAHGPEPHFRSIYVAAIVSLLAVTAVVPILGFFKFAHDAASELATKHEQLALLTKLRDRADRISRHSDRWDADFIRRRGQQTLDRYDTLQLQPFTYPRARAHHNSQDESETGWHLLDQHAFDRGLEWGFHLFPANQLGKEMRQLPFESGSSKESDCKERPAFTEELQTPFFEIDEHTFRMKLNGQCVDASFAGWPDASMDSLRMYLGLFIFLLGVYGWLALLTKRIFLSCGFKPFEEVDWKRAEDITTSALVLREPWDGTRNRLEGITGTDYVDLRASPENPAAKLLDQNNVVVLDHFDFNMGNRTSNLARLQLLEELLYTKRRRVVIGTSADPVAYLSDGDFGRLADNAQGAAELLGRWKLVMSGFRPVSFKEPTLGQLLAASKPLIEQGGRMKQLASWVREECEHTPYLREVGFTLLEKLKAGPEPDLRQLQEEVRARTDSYYEALWSTFTRDERLVLFQLSRDGWANPQNKQAIVQLRRKGILCVRPMLRIMNESFRLFAIEAQDRNEIDAWERQGKESSWRTFKFSFVIVGVGLAMWLLYVQKDLFQSTIGYAVALGTAITAISNLFGAFKGRSGPAPKAPDAAA